jgi:hypothetical protein
MTLAVPGYIHRPHTESANCIEKVRPSHRIGPHTLTIVDVARHVPAAHSSDRGRARASELDTVSGVRMRWQVFAGIANLSFEMRRDEKVASMRDAVDRTASGGRSVSAREGYINYLGKALVWFSQVLALDIQNIRLRRNPSNKASTKSCPDPRQTARHQPAPRLQAATSTAHALSRLHQTIR